MAIERILHSYSIHELLHKLSSDEAPIILLTAPNYEDRSVTVAEWFRDQFYSMRNKSLGVQVVWFQAPGVDNILDRIKASNRDRVIRLFDIDSDESIVNPRLVQNVRVDYPNGNILRVVDSVRSLASRLGGNATLLFDFSSMPRSIMRNLLQELLNDDNISSTGKNPDMNGLISKYCFLYTNAHSYPEGLENDIIGGILGYFSRKSVDEMVESAAMLDAIISLSGSSHSVSQAVDSLLSYERPEGANIGSLVLLNRNNLLYSYKQSARITWALNEVMRYRTDVVYAFDFADMIRHVFDRCDIAILNHLQYKKNGGEDLPGFLVGGFGPKPIELAAYLARKRYLHLMKLGGYSGFSDVLHVAGYQYTTRYSHGVGSGGMSMGCDAINVFELNVSELLSPLVRGDRVVD